MMNRFAPALRRTLRELDLPRDVRAEIILEMAADLEAAYEDHRRRGATEEEARERAEDAVLGSFEVIRRLSRLHRDSGSRWSQAIGSRLGRGVDLVILLAGVLPMLVLAAAVAGRSLTSVGVVLAGPFLAMGALIAALVVAEARRTRSGLRAGRRGGLSLLLVTSAVAPALGLLALVLGLRDATSELALGAPDAAAQIELMAQVGSSGSLFAAGLLLGIAGALAWFVLRTRGLRTAEREVDDLLSRGSGPDAPLEADGIIPLAQRRPA